MNFWTALWYWVPCNIDANIKLMLAKPNTNIIYPCASHIKFGEVVCDFSNKMTKQENIIFNLCNTLGILNGITISLCSIKDSIHKSSERTKDGSSSFNMVQDWGLILANERAGENRLSQIYIYIIFWSPFTKNKRLNGLSQTCLCHLHTMHLCWLHLYFQNFLCRENMAFLMKFSFLHTKLYIIWFCVHLVLEKTWQHTLYVICRTATRQTDSPCTIT